MAALVTTTAFPTLSSPVTPVSRGGMHRSASKKSLGRMPVKAGFNQLSSSGISLPGINQSTVTTAKTAIPGGQTPKGVGALARKFFSPIVRSKSKILATQPYKELNSQKSSEQPSNYVGIFNPLASSVQDKQQAIQPNRATMSVPKVVKVSTSTTKGDERLNINLSLLSPSYNEKGSREDVLTPSTEESYPDSPQKRIIVKKRGEKEGKPSIINNSGSASPVREPKLPDYFTRHVKACVQSHEAYSSDELNVEARVRQLHKYMEDNHRNLTLLREDYIVERPTTFNYKRKQPRKKLLLLDLDETLIHCTGDHSKRNLFDHVVDFVNHEGDNLVGYLNIRPKAQTFLKEVSQHFEVVVFTASLKYYADRIIKILDPKRQYISDILYREACCKTKSGKLVKDLQVIGGVALENMILVDNNMYSMWPQPTNGIPILHFTFDRNDRELEHLQEYLIAIAQQPHQKRFTETFRVKELMYSQSLADYYSKFENCN